ncbi:unnamed protein product [Aspergillus oryzae]|nr:unnamed protein product [Aspergillus oryzae]
MATTNASAFNPRTQLLPHIVDHYAKVKPEAIYAEYPISLMTYEDGYRPITFRLFANAINGIAWWLTEKLGPGNGEILAYVGPNDLRYPALVLGAVKAGYRVSDCKLVAPVPRPPPVKAILEAQPTVEILDVPSVDDLTSKDYPHFEFLKTYSEVAGETLAAAGLAYSLFISIPVSTTIIFPASGGLPTAAALVEARKKTPIDILLGVPSIIQELSQSPELLDYCSRHMSRLIYCGGDLPQPIGDTVAAKIKLTNLYGASEVGMISTIHSKTDRNPLKDWRYLHINPQMGAELRQVTDREHELVLVRDPEFKAHQFSFTIFPDRQEYHTNDLFVRHPEKPDLWRWSSRADDVIVFLNGEKTNPVSMEQYVAVSNPEVSAVLVAGARRFQASLLVELEPGKQDLNITERAAMIEKLWPSIEQANAVCPAHARVAKTHILFTKPGKPMLRAGKGTIQRAGTLALYAAELDALYTDADRLSQADNEQQASTGRVDDPQLLADYIRQSMISVTGWNQLSNTENFFELGLDSLQAITVTRIFRRGLNFPTFSPNLIYLHPSVKELTQTVLRLQQHHEASAEATKEAQLQQRDQLLLELSAQITPRASEKHIVMLTGSTGSLGTYILDTLLKAPSVAHIHCLNRKDNAVDIQRQKSEAYGLNLDMSRVSFWTSDLSKPGLGLQSDVLDILQTTTLVIHNAWAVNFNLSLASFKPNLAGVVNLINFCGKSGQNPHLFFISSISSTMGHRTDNGLTPETVIKTTSPAPNGYADSKYLAEQLLDQAARQDPVHVHSSFARVGQIAGPVRSPGLWNKAEWFPSLVMSSLHLGALPNTLGPVLNRVDWMPIDLLAEVLVDLALRDHGVSAGGSVKVYHPVNPRPLDWEAVRPFVVEALSKTSGETVDTIPFQDWVQRVRQDIETGAKLNDGELQALLARNPAAKLLQFFEGIMSQTERENVLDTRLTVQLSEKLQAVDAVKPEWIQKWVEEWLQ